MAILAEIWKFISKLQLCLKKESLSQNWAFWLKIGTLSHHWPIFQKNDKSGSK